MGNSLADKLAGEVADRVQVCLKVAEDCAEYYVTTQLIHSLEEMTCRLLLLYIYIYIYIYIYAITENRQTNLRNVKDLLNIHISIYPHSHISMDFPIHSYK